MKNLEQIRAKNALGAAKQGGIAGKAGGEVVKKVPTMIRENGLLAALAFAVERKDKGELKNKGYFDTFSAIAAHLGKDSEPDAMLRRLSETDSGTLRSDTAEAMAYLAYLRRFASKEA